MDQRTSPVDGTPADGASSAVSGADRTAGDISRIVESTSEGVSLYPRDGTGPGPGRPASIDDTGGASPDEQTATVTGGVELTGRTSLIPVIPGFEIEHELGRGGMGVVYKARRVLLNRSVALKMILGGGHAGHEAGVRFLAEAEAVAKLQHPNIVQIYHIDEHAGHAYFEMEYVAGGSLAQRLDGTPRSPRESAWLVETLARAMAEAHRVGIVHRDLKPGNVLLTPEGVPKVADFGLAKHLNADSGLTRTDSVLGSPSYMAPEQTEGKSKEVGPPADLYALGVILYEQLTGRPPFRAATVLETLQLVKTAEPVPPGRLVPGLPRDVETIVLKCLQKDPGRRYESAGALAEDLRRYQAGEPILARPVPAVEHAWLWCRRNPVLAGSTAAVGAALIAVAVISMVYARAQGRATEKITGLASDLRGERESLKASLALSNRRLAVHNFERGLAAFEKDDIGSGLLWTLESWRSAIEAGDADWQGAARANLAAWSSQCAPLKAVFSHSDSILSIACSPDGTMIVTGSEDKTARLWDTVNARAIGAPFELPAPVTAVAFSPDGKTVLIGCSGEVRFWATATGAPLGKILRHPGALAAAAFAADGAMIVCAGGLEAWRFNFRTGEPLGSTLRVPSAIMAAAFSKDGDTLLAGVDDGSEARLWNMTTGQPESPPIPHRWRVYSVAFSPDDKTFFTGTWDGVGQVWDRSTWQPIGPPMNHRRHIRAAAFSPDGKSILTGCVDNSARLWDVATGLPLGRPFPHQGPVVGVGFSPDGQNLFTASSDRTARLWTANAGTPVALVSQHRSLGGAAAFRADDRAIVTACVGKTARVWDVETGAPIGPFMQHPGAVTAVAFSPDGKSILTGCQDGNARFWDAATGKPMGMPLRHSGPVRVVLYSPDGGSVLTSCPDNSARLWNVATGSIVGEPLAHSSEVDAAAFSPDGKTVLTGCVSKTQLWDVATGTPLGKPFPHAGAASALAFSPDGRTFLVGGEDGTARLWDQAVHAPVGPPLRHEGWIFAVAISPDGKTLLTGSTDGTVQCWSAATGMRLGPRLNHQYRVVTTAFSHDGKSILTGCLDETARVFRTYLELPDQPDRAALWIESLTGLAFDSQDGLLVLDNEAWADRCERLNALGGAPESALMRRLDPIDLIGGHAQRAGVYLARRQWAKAEAAFAHALLARPTDRLIILERGRFLDERSRHEEARKDFLTAYELGNFNPWLLARINSDEALFERALARLPGEAVPLLVRRGTDLALQNRWGAAAADFRQALVREPEQIRIGHHYLLLLRAAGMESELGQARSELIERLAKNAEPSALNDVAWLGAISGSGGGHAEKLVRLAERAVNASRESENPAVLNTLGAALYRAKRFEDAVNALENGIRRRKGQSIPQDWAFLALANHQLGRADKAREWLLKFRGRPGDSDPRHVWDELEILLLRNESESVIVFDPIFPREPFIKQDF